MRHHDLKQQARGGRAADVHDAVVDLGSELRQLLGGKLLRLGAQDVGAVHRGVYKRLPKSIRHGADHQQVTEAVQQIQGEAAWLVAGLHHRVDGVENGGGVVGGKGVHGGVDKRKIRDTQQRQGKLIGQTVRAGAGEQLIQDGQRVTRRTATRADNQRVDVLIHHNTLFGHHALKQLPHRSRREQAERVIVRTGTDGGQDFLRLRGGEDEDEVLWRLLHNLQQRVVAGRGNHVRLINDEHAVARLSRRKQRTFAQVTHVLDAAVRRRVQLHHIQVAGAARGQRHTRRALTTRRGRRPMHTVQRTREDTRRRCLAAATRTREQVRVRDTPVIQRGGQRSGHLLLADDLTKRRGTIFPVQSHVQQSTEGPLHPRDTQEARR